MTLGSGGVVSWPCRWRRTIDRGTTGCSLSGWRASTGRYDRGMVCRVARDEDGLTTWSRNLEVPLLLLLALICGRTCWVGLGAGFFFFFFLLPDVKILSRFIDQVERLMYTFCLFRWFSFFIPSSTCWHSCTRITTDSRHFLSLYLQYKPNDS